MIQGLLAIILLVLALGLYLWGRRPVDSVPPEDPDVILGLTESQQQPLVGQAEIFPSTEAIEAVQPQPPVVTQFEREILLLRAPVDHQYRGYELLQALLTCGLRFGEKNFFHRYEQHAEGQTVLFSVAAATETGELNPDNMGNFSFSGLSFFIILNQHIYPSVNFELMLDTARQLAEDLGGVLLDEKQAVLTREKVQKIREKIKNFETRQQTMELFA